MKKLILLMVIHLFVFNVHSQVKIGAPGNPDVNAVLELAGSSKGLLLPRLALTGLSSAAPLSAFVAGMVVYNTANVSDVRPGYYYSDGVKWIRISNSLETWALSGNGGTNPASQFLGTTDSTNLSLRTNNLERIRITGSGTVRIATSILIGTETTVTNAKLSIFDGHLQSGQTTEPDIAATGNIGLGGSAQLQRATDVAGHIALNQGSGFWGSGPIAIVTFNKVYENEPIVVITPANAAAANAMVNVRPYITTTTAGFTLNFAVASNSQLNLRFNYFVIEAENF